MRFKAFVSISQITGVRRSLRAVRSVLSKFAFRDVLIMVSRLNFLLGYNQLLPGKAASDAEPTLAGFLLRPERIKDIERLKRESQSDRVVFSRHQMLVMLRQAALACIDTAGRSFTDEAARQEFGEACLIVNDHLVSPLQLQAINRGTLSKRTQHLALQLAFLTEFYNPLLPKRALVRADRSLAEVATSVTMVAKSGEMGFHAVEAFESRTGLAFEDYRDLLLHVLTRYFSLDPGKAIREPDWLVFHRDKYLRDTQIPADLFETFLGLETVSLTEIRNRLRERRQASSVLDAMALRMTPLVEIEEGFVVCPDPTFLAEKLGYGIKWSVVNALPDRRASARALEWFGHLFEAYVAALLSEIYPPASGRYYPSPRFLNSDQACDGLLLYPDQAIWYEAKGGGLPEPAKYSGRWRLFEEGLERTFGDHPGGAIAQLAGNIERAFHASRDQREQIDGIDTSKILRLNCVLFVQEPFLRGPLINWILNRMFRKAIARRKITDRVQILPLTVLEIGTLELLKESIGHHDFTLQQALNALVARDPEGKASADEAFSNLFPNSYGKVDDPDRAARLDAIMERAGRKAFGPGWSPGAP